MAVDPMEERKRHLTRRQFFGRSAVGIGAAALASLLERRLRAAMEERPVRSPGLQKTAGPGGLPGLPHFAPRAKRVIYLLQNGAPSHVDLFDYKPGLAGLRGTDLPDSVRGGQRLSTMTEGQARKRILPGIAGWKRHGQGGAWISDLLPHTASIADEICIIRSMHTNAINHAPAITFFLTGAEQPGRPSMGSWLSYGLGSDTEDLPAFVVMTSRDREASCGQIFYDFYWGSGFLPTKLQGVKFRGEGDPVLYLSSPEGMSRAARRGILDDLRRLNEMKFDEIGDPEITTRIAQYEMAYRMQASVPELTDISKEPKHVLEM